MRRRQNGLALILVSCGANCHSFQYSQLLTLVFLEAFGMIFEKINLDSLNIHLTQTSSAGEKPTHFSYKDHLKELSIKSMGLWSCTKQIRVYLSHI